MSKKSENRRHQRLPVKFASFVYRQRDPHKALLCEVVNLSLGGALVRCEDPTLTVGEEIVVEIQHGPGYLLKARVAQVENVAIHLDESDLEDPRVEWAHGDSGFVRVAFQKLPPKREKAFHRLIESLEEAHTTKQVLRKASGG
jgi:hypothetical protein